MSSEPFVGEIRMVGFDFAPRGWALCDGQLLNISENTSLFSLLGTTYGGDGQTTFGLPDLRGRVPLHAGQGVGLSLRQLGEGGGQETVTLVGREVPTHTHPTGDISVKDVSAPVERYAVESELRVEPEVVQSVGGQSHENMPPFRCVNFIIALQGIYPSRS
jgi:microcystin-dependent protein